MPRPPSHPGALQAAEEGAPAAEARLRGLFVPVPVPMPVPTGGTARMVAPQRASEAGAQPGEAGPGAAAKGAAAAGAGAGFEPGTAALLAGRQGQRVTVQVGRQAARGWGCLPILLQAGCSASSALPDAASHTHAWLHPAGQRRCDTSASLDSVDRPCSAQWRRNGWRRQRRARALCVRRRRERRRLGRQR